MPEPTAGRGSVRSRRVGRKAPFAAVVAVASLAGVWLATVVTLGFMPVRPEIKLRFWPVSASAMAALAAQTVTATASAPEAQRIAMDRARAALRREPVNVVAARTLGLIYWAQNDVTRGKAWLQYAEGLSRRDAPTEIALIEAAVNANDVPGTLRHYDRALKTSRNNARLLFPVLLEATREPIMADNLAPFIAERPVWWYPFMLQAVQQGLPSSSLFKLFKASRIDANDKDQRDLAVAGMKRMVADGGIDLADRLRADVVRRMGPRPGSATGPSTFPTLLPPFDWSIPEDPDLTASVEIAADGQDVLRPVANAGRTGVVAQRLVRLVPGVHRITVRYADVAVDGIRPVVTGWCAGSDTAATRHDLPPTGEGRAAGVTWAWRSPTTCPWLWLRVEAAAPDVSDVASPTIASIRLD